jgi:predicted RNA-binding Zn-ribbon protein involved in translation (DUF1610 family)
MPRNQPNRRRFLKTAAAAASAPFIIRRHVLAQDGNTGAIDRIKIGKPKLQLGSSPVAVCGKMVAAVTGTSEFGVPACAAQVSRCDRSRRGFRHEPDRTRTRRETTDGRSAPRSLPGIARAGGTWPSRAGRTRRPTVRLAGYSEQTAGALSGEDFERPPWGDLPCRDNWPREQEVTGKTNDVYRLCCLCSLVFKFHPSVPAARRRNHRDR